VTFAKFLAHQIVQVGSKKTFKQLHEQWIKSERESSNGNNN
jgi:hypothetical protein